MSFWYLFLLLPAIFIFYFLLKRIIPKGNLIHEVLHLPDFWWRVWRMPIDSLKITKHFYGPHRRQYILCCEPTEGKKDLKEVVVYFHGGAWMVGTPELFQSNALFFTANGQTVFLPSYRRIPFFGYPSIESDLDQIFLKIEALKKEKGLNPGRQLIGGMSAGGNVAALMAFDRQRFSRLGIDQQHFSGLFLFGAPLFLDGMFDSLILKWYAGKRKSETYQKANPVEHLKEKEQLPVLCLHGDKDGMVPLAAAAGFVQQLKKVHSGTLHFRVMENGTHLDSASWTYQDNEVRSHFLNWLEETSPR